MALLEAGAEGVELAFAELQRMPKPSFVPGNGLVLCAMSTAWRVGFLGCPEAYAPLSKVVPGHLTSA